MKNWQIEFSLAHPHGSTVSEDYLDEFALELMEGGADGTSSVSVERIVAYVLDRSEDEAKYFAQQFSNEFVIKTSWHAVEDKNWTQCSNELLQPLTIGELTITPVSSAEMVPTSTPAIPGPLYIIPGMGFGTGHHPTTKSIVALLQTNSIVEKLSGEGICIFDFGTGSGLLSIATQLLYPHAIIDAADNDPAAIENARENAAINGCGEITFSVSSSIPTKSYNGIVANIYAEVLIQHEAAMFMQLCASGVLILSGIMSEKASLIDRHFTGDRWQLIEEINDKAGWITRAYLRNEGRSA